MVPVKWVRPQHQALGTQRCSSHRDVRQACCGAAGAPSSPQAPSRLPPHQSPAPRRQIPSIRQRLTLEAEPQARRELASLSVSTLTPLSPTNLP